MPGHHKINNMKTTESHGVKKGKGKGEKGRIKRKLLVGGGGCYKTILGAS